MITKLLKAVAVNILLLLFLGSNIVRAQDHKAVSDTIVYKTVGDSTDLHLFTIHPENFAEKDKWPVMIFFHGGGWNRGSYTQFLEQAKHFSRLGFYSVLVEYRVNSKHNSTPFESLMDAKSAVRFLKEHASNYRIDPFRIVAVGGSAGGLLAAGLEMVDNFNDPNDNLEVSTAVDALILFNPVLDTGPDGYGYDRIGKHYRDFSPLYQSKKGAAPTLIMLGTQDKFISSETMRKFCSEMKAAKSDCKLVLYEGQRHGFFNHGLYYDKTLQVMKDFLSGKDL